MWELKKPNPVKLIIGILAADETALKSAVTAIEKQFGTIDLSSDVWPFDATDYYTHETGSNILRQFLSIEKLISPGKLAAIKHKANRLEKRLAKQLKADLSRPVNLDPGIIEPSKLILATTKNFSHRIYIGKKMYAELTLSFNKGIWQSFEYTFPDYQQACYQDFFSKVRTKLVEQLRK